jgi:hypothetical protein
MEVFQSANHKNWAPERKNAVRDKAQRATWKMYARRIDPRVTKIQNAVLACSAVLGFFAFLMSAVHLIEYSF